MKKLLRNLFILLILIIAFPTFFLFLGIILLLFLFFGFKAIKNTKFEYRYYKNDYDKNYEYNSNINVMDEYEKACKVLKVNVNDEFEVKKRARKELLKKYHPDFYIDEIEKEKATQKTNEINNAWEIIEKYSK